MEELQPEELEELVQELEGKSQEEEPFSPEVEGLLTDLDVEGLLTDLQTSSLDLQRQRAADRLGKLRENSPRIVRALITAGKSDSSLDVRQSAMESLRAPAHQEILQKYPDLMQQYRSAAEKAAIQRERQRGEQREKQRAMKTREVHNRKDPNVGRWIYAFIPFGIVWVVVSGIATTSNQWDFWCFPFVALPGVTVVALALWKWRAATANREVLDRTAKETVGTVEGKRKSVSDSDYGSTTTYYVTVRFEAEDAKVGTRVMVLNARVSRHVFKWLKSGESIGIRYAAEDPRIALIQLEW